MRLHFAHTNNPLAASSFREVGQLTSLQQLDLPCQHLSGDLSSLANLTSHGARSWLKEQNIADAKNHVQKRKQDNHYAGNPPPDQNIDKAGTIVQASDHHTLIVRKQFRRNPETL